MSSAELDQLVDSGRARKLLARLAAIFQLGLAVRAEDGTLLAEAGPNGAGGGPAAQAAIEIGAERVGWVTAAPDGVAAAAVAALLGELLSDEAAQALELERLVEEVLGKYEEINLLHELSESLGSVFDVAGACEIALDKALQAAEAERGLVALTDEDGGALVVAARGLDAAPGATIAAGAGISGHVAAIGRQLLLHGGQEWAAGLLEERRGLEPALSVPLSLADEPEAESTLGALTLAGKPEGKRFTAGEARLAATIARQLANAVRHTRQVDTLREAERVSREVELAEGVQRTMLPSSAPQVPGLALAGLYIPAAKIGGDYYDFVIDGAGRLSIVIADVAGHGIGSALMMAMARTVLRREIGAGKAPGAVLHATNEALFDDLVNTGLFITMFCARYDPATRAVAYANGGHNLPILRRAGGELLELNADGVAVGILTGIDYEERTVDLAPGDLLVLYTDGVVEASSPGGEQFGSERLAALLADASGPPGELADRIHAAARAHAAAAPQSDDVTLIVAEALGGGR